MARGVKRGAFSGGPSLPSGPQACDVCKVVLANRWCKGQHMRRVHQAPEPKKGGPPPQDVCGASRTTAPVATLAGANPASVAIHVDPAWRPTPARYLPNAVPVPQPMLALPWVRFPRGRADLERSVAIVAGALGQDLAEPVRTFFATLEAHLVALGERAASA